ncbi:MAG: universal stress protein [Burkholderiaceae bacterium]
MKVLLAVDGSPYTQRMLDYLVSHPDLLGKVEEYTVLTVVPAIPSHPASFVGRDVVEGYYKEQADLVLDPVRAFAHKHDWKLDARYAAGHGPDIIAKVANSGNFDLLLMGTHGHSALSGLVLGSVTSRVIAQTKLPVLLIR